MEQPHNKQMFIPSEWVTLTRGRYRALSWLGEGGQSAVWKAVRESDGAVVVLRTINLFNSETHQRDTLNLDVVEELIASAESEIRFMETIPQADATRHFIVPMLDKGYIIHPEHPEVRLPTTVMPWFEQDDLSGFSRSRVKDAKDANGSKIWSFSGQELLRWARQLATALVYIHQEHSDTTPSVHRDIKPGNVLLDKDGNVGLADFGLVRAAAHLGTRTTRITHGYCAPEQLLAIYRTAEEGKFYLITPAVDIYALAITLHDLLAGLSKAQQKLSEKKVVEDHDIPVLLGTGKQQCGRIGALGKLGGLTDAEQRYLHAQLLDLLQPSNKNQTIALGKERRSLPDVDFIADGMVGLLERMLAPWHADRPTALEVLAGFTALEQCLTPTLEDFTLSLAQDQLTMGQTCTLRVSVKGGGLPADWRWLRFECNAQPLLGLQPVWVGEARHGLLPAEVGQSMEVVVPLPAETGDYRLKVVATVAGKTHWWEVVCHVTLTAEQWWGLGKHEEALRLELRQDWLGSLLKQAATLDELVRLRGLLQGLQSHYPLNTPEQKLLQEALEKVEKMGWHDPRPPPRSLWKVWGRRLLTLALGVAMLVVINKIYTDNNQRIKNFEQQSSNHLELSQQTLSALKIIENSSDADVQRSYLHDLKELAVSGHPDVQPEAKHLLDGYFDGANAGYESNTAEGAKLALARSTVLAEEKNAAAMIMLGMLYRSGLNGIEKNSELGCNWLKKAGDAGYDLTKVNYAKLCSGQ